MKKEYICCKCRNVFHRYPSTVRNENAVFCSVDCKNEWQIGKVAGENNPNFGNRWDDRQKKRQSGYMKENLKDPEFRFRIGSGNRGKKFSKERIHAMHGHRDFESYSRKFSEETKKKIGDKSKAKFTEEFNKRFRKTMEDNGHWIPLSEKSDWDIYKKLSNWKSQMFDLVENKKEIKLLNELGVFNNRTNKKGVVRDHKYSRRSGCGNGVFPEILRHPRNCEIVTHSYNVKKTGVDTMSLDELFDAIINYKGHWVEQDQCIKMIERYKNGEKWERSEIRA